MFNGKKSKVVAVGKDVSWGRMVTWNFHTPIYLSLKGSSDRLEFMLTDEHYTDKNVAFESIKMQIIIE